MVAAYLFSVVLLFNQVEVGVSVPDSVMTGEIFTCQLTIMGEGGEELSCDPVYSSGLHHLGTGSSHSFSTVSTPSGTRTSSATVLSMKFAATSSGSHALGPFIVMQSGTTVYETPSYTVTATGSGSSPPSFEAGSENLPLAWMEIEVDSTKRIYSGETFTAEYYICKSSRSVEVVDLFLEPSDYATSTLIRDADQLNWARTKEGFYRTWIGTMEITPAFACTLTLPELRGRVGIPGGIAVLSREQLISTGDFSVPVYPFPEEGRPDNFTGITGDLEFSCARQSAGYSSGGEKCIVLTARGSGAADIDHLPELTVSGPASVFPGRGILENDSTRIWNLIVDPSDSGTVTVGPDSLAWFDTSAEEYRQAIIPACTTKVYPITSSPSARIPDLNHSGGGILIPLILFILIAISAVLVISTVRKRRNTRTDISQSRDVEELLTALGDSLSEQLTGSRSYLGSEELDQALDSADVDVILARRILRHWKDLELLLTGRTVSDEQLSHLRRKSLELLEELDSELPGS